MLFQAQEEKLCFIFMAIKKKIERNIIPFEQLDTVKEKVITVPLMVNWLERRQRHISFFLLHKGLLLQKPM